MCAWVSNNTDKRKIALAIGNKNYKQSPLDNSGNDANDLSEALQSIGFVVITKTNLNHEDMGREIDQFIQSIRPNDLVVFFFSGHGVQHEDINYLIPCDNDRIVSMSDFQYRATNVKRMMDVMSDKKPFVIIYLLDCCRTYSSPHMSRSKGTGSAAAGLACMAPNAGMLIAFACAPGTVATDEAPNGKNGMFTYHLLKHLIRPGEDIMISLRHVATGVCNDTRQRQIPHMTCALTWPHVCLASSQKGAALTVKSIPNNSSSTVISRQQGLFFLVF
ncbi:unnamed protein product [Rotaria magnacalcarata]|uniref:Caspase family p20 domain-containing protein n=2 Tax=Rotaria magnacalcarata TaxID=392030 RepID=A0A820GGG3_9BILA|nr:unnamed protein product [Rotaria magnacalcarata]CAF2253596.1 unnamed protein product [Rotaria magnacalcarata]CAF4279107.1 unnamed protein product [Rotaria magnacalcarata]